MNKAVDLKWKSLKDEVIRRGGNGEDVVDALIAHHALYDKGLLAWLGGLYDSKVGGFYYSNSARRSEDPRFLPDIESTNQALNILIRTGLIDSYSELPASMIEGMRRFTCSLMSEEDGFIYHPQWGKDISDNRRGRDLIWAEDMTEKLGFSLPYKTATERLKESIEKTEPIPKEETLLPDHLSSKEKFLKYLEEYDWKNGAYGAGNNVAAQYRQIISAGLLDVCLDFLTSVQNPENGLWGNEENYNTVNGLFKINGLYNLGKRSFPNAYKAAMTAMDCITRFDEPTGWVACLYNTWESIQSLRRNLREYCGQNGNMEADKIDAEILRRAPEAIRASTKKISEFKKPDGSFSYFPRSTSCHSQGVLVAVPKPEGGAPDEGDVNATVMSATSLTGDIYGTLMLGEYRIPLYSKEDLHIFIDALNLQDK